MAIGKIPKRIYRALSSSGKKAVKTAIKRAKRSTSKRRTSRRRY